MELEVIDIFRIAGKNGLCYMVESFDGWETINTFNATGKANGSFTIIERDKLRSALPKNNDEPIYIGFIATPNDDKFNTKSEFIGTINSKLDLPDIVVSMGDYKMSTSELNDIDFGILNTLINNQIKHDSLTDVEPDTTGVQHDHSECGAG